jgi:hypothetical protein
MCQNGWFLTKFFSMNDNSSTNRTDNRLGFFQRTRNKFAVLQEIGFERNENKLRELLKDERDLVQFPIPLFLPAFLVWLFMLLFPLVLILDPTNALKMSVNIKGLVGFYWPMLSTVFIFILNQRFLVPQLVFKKRYALYFVCNSILVVATLFFREVAFFVMERTPNEGISDFFSSYCFSFVKGHFGVWPVISFTILVAFVCVLCVLYHVMFRQIVRAFILREQKRSELQYELDFLKNQLSPHFLFNTLNNISALIQIDPKRAESSMNKLSQLLRMMLYQVKDKYITLQEDVDILQKYADLEKLRLDEGFDFVFKVELENPKLMIEPLLMMPLMENAMKHCVNPNGKSFAHITITQMENEIHFHSENSNFPRKSGRKNGGLGLTTFEKRLDLIYSGSYEYSVNIVDDVYISDLIIHLKKENS